MYTPRFLIAFLVLIIAACSEAPVETVEGPGAQPDDRFSYANKNEVVIRHIDLDLNVNFDEKILEGTAAITFEVLDEGAEKLVLDTRDLDIRSVTAGGEHLLFMVSARDDLLGSKLEIDLPEEGNQLVVGYATTPGASGLQWLNPEQTQSGQHPFLFSQSQAIHARSWVPLQDTPGVRFTYTANLKTPPALVALMSSAQDQDGIKDGDYTFDMPQAIPSYLMAIAVGDLEFRAISDTIGVYAESYIVDAAAAEFEDAPIMEEANARLYGPYQWGRYDLLVLPPSFPFGGMENPRLSFMTPTLIAGDKSLTNVLAHELAHSWAGNQVTNSTWGDSWINEGITSYVENRVMEEVFGVERAIMEQALGKEDWLRDMNAIEDPRLTALALPDEFNEPFDAFTNVAYVKGQFFLNFLEDRFGREVFDPFLKSYFDHFAFQSISTEDFIGFMNQNLIAPNPGRVTDAEIQEWLFGPGMPESTRNPVSTAFEKVAEDQAAFLAGGEATALPTANWTTHEWLHFLNTLPDDMSEAQFETLDSAFNLTDSPNAEIAFAWYMKAMAGGYGEIDDSLREFLIRVGRGKFIYRLYARLIETGRREWAAEIYAIARPGYHPIAQANIDNIFGAE